LQELQLETLAALAPGPDDCLLDVGYASVLRPRRPIAPAGSIYHRA
jgi:hypothetical protein